MPVRPLAMFACLAALAACTSGSTGANTGAGTPARPPATGTAPTVGPSSSTAPSSSGPTVGPTRTRKPSPTRTRHPRSATPTPTHSPTPTRTPAARLPLDYSTGSARQVVTVTAPAQSATQGSLQAWRRVSGGWKRVGPSVPAWLGSAGMTPHPSEQLSATPMGSYPLTQAFGHDPDPGTALPYRHTTPADWWISQAGPLYNTLQHCTGSCPFHQGDPNEHLYYETPHYNYAVVIDYNRDPVRQGAGSAFFLHVAVGEPTAGCVSIEQSQLVRILRWLTPSRHPRILIGTR